MDVGACDDKLKKAERVLRELGMSPTEAIRLFYRQICLRGGVPFLILIPNERVFRLSG